MQIIALADRGVRMDDLLLLRPDLEHRTTVQSKIVGTLAAVKTALDAARHAGRHILYLPGSYDLVHAGHASHIMQAIERYLSLAEYRSLAREDLYVVALADDDDLIAAVKAAKFIGNGGTEPFRRPIRVASERLYELASIPMVDLAGCLPSPLRIGELPADSILRAQCRRSEIVSLVACAAREGGSASDDAVILTAALGKYDDTIRFTRTEPQVLVDAFRRRIPPWSIQSWQLFLHRYLGAGKFPAPIVRVISRKDAGYLAQVRFLMRAAEIDTLVIDEVPVTTTTELLQRHGLERLAAAKHRFWGG